MCLSCHVIFVVHLVLMENNKNKTHTFISVEKMDGG